MSVNPRPAPQPAHDSPDKTATSTAAKRRLWAEGRRIVAARQRDAQPITGAELGAALGVSDRQGRRLLAEYRANTPSIDNRQPANGTTPTRPPQPPSGRDPGRGMAAGGEQAERPRLLTVGEVLAAPVTGDPRWERRARCNSGEYDPELWWPPRGSDNGAAARRICVGCPVLGDCREWFLLAPPGVDRESGIWAGLSGRTLWRAARSTRERQSQTRQKPGTDRVRRVGVEREGWSR